MFNCIHTTNHSIAFKIKQVETHNHNTITINEFKSQDKAGMKILCLVVLCAFENICHMHGLTLIDYKCSCTGVWYLLFDLYDVDFDLHGVEFDKYIVIGHLHG